MRLLKRRLFFAVKFIASDWDDWGSPLGSMYAEIDGQGWG